MNRPFYDNCHEENSIYCQHVHVKNSYFFMSHICLKILIIKEDIRILVPHVESSLKLLTLFLRIDTSGLPPY